MINQCKSKHRHTALMLAHHPSVVPTATVGSYRRRRNARSNPAVRANQVEASTHHLWMENWRWRWTCRQLRALPSRHACSVDDWTAATTSLFHFHVRTYASTSPGGRGTWSGGPAGLSIGWAGLRLRLRDLKESDPR